jgi:hypothetical protein
MVGTREGGLGLVVRVGHGLAGRNGSTGGFFLLFSFSFLFLFSYFNSQIPNLNLVRHLFSNAMSQEQGNTIF